MVECLTGLINGALYHIILSAALDIVGPSIPKGMVLLVDVLPCFVAKLFAVPLNFHKVPYWFRIIAFVALSTSGMLLIALSPDDRSGTSIAVKLVGIALASVSAGGGDLSFIGLTHHYGHLSLAAWSSGSGATGLLGSGAYVAATVWLGYSVKSSLLLFSLLPVILLLTFFVILPNASMQVIHSEGLNDYEPIVSDDIHVQEYDTENTEQQEALHPPYSSADSRSPREPWAEMNIGKDGILKTFQLNLVRCRQLFIP
jgi:battenin